MSPTLAFLLPPCSLPLPHLRGQQGAGMADENQMLDTKEVADMIGVEPNTVRTYLKRTRRREVAGEDLRAQDFPLPDKIFGDSPAWLPSTIRAWLSERPGPGRPSTRS